MMGIMNPEKLAADKKNMIHILENWKKKQKEEKPVMIIINTSGGGTRSATFTMNVLQRLDSLCTGELMKNFPYHRFIGRHAGSSIFQRDIGIS
jgi:hypothetical protein